MNNNIRKKLRNFEYGTSHMKTKSKLKFLFDRYYVPDDSYYSENDNLRESERERKFKPGIRVVCNQLV